jgi:hypothetical protein
MGTRSAIRFDASLLILARVVVGLGDGLGLIHGS